MKNNKEIRIKALESGVWYWQIAAELGIAPESFSRMMRKELEGEAKEKVLRAIEAIVNDRNGGNAG